MKITLFLTFVLFLFFASASYGSIFNSPVINIDNCEELFKINPIKEMHYRLTRDLDCKGVHNMIGDAKNPFKGKFDYNGKKVNANLIPPSLTGSVFFEEGINFNFSLHKKILIIFLHNFTF